MRCTGLASNTQSEGSQIVLVPWRNLIETKVHNVSIYLAAKEVSTYGGRLL